MAVPKLRNSLTAAAPPTRLPSNIATPSVRMPVTGALDGNVARTAFNDTWFGGGPTRSATPIVTGVDGYKQVSTNKDDFGAPGWMSRVNRSNAEYQARTDNASRAAEEFYKREGGRMSDPYERAEQDRRMYRDKDRMRFADPRNPQQLLQDRLGSEAYSFRKSLPELMAQKRDQLSLTAGSALGEGLHKTRANMSSRGLLNSGMREGAEGSMRARTANTLASQQRQSNAELSKMADSRDQAAAVSGLQGAKEAMEAQRMADDLNMQNEIRRMQMWQQMARGVGEVTGAAIGYNRDQQKDKPPPNNYMATLGGGYGTAGGREYDPDRTWA